MVWHWLCNHSHTWKHSCNVFYLILLQLTLVLAESDGTIEIGSERQAVKAGEFKMQFTLEYEFCGDGGRECFNDTMQPTVGKVLKACFEGKVSEWLNSGIHSLDKVPLSYWGSWSFRA